MSNNYWTIDEWLIFKPRFNEELTNYHNIINKYNKIMFRNSRHTIFEVEDLYRYICKFI